MTSSAGIDATSITALLNDLRSNGNILDSRTVLVIDEAAMVGTRSLAEEMKHCAAAGTKLVLVGDHAQLPKIDAGVTAQAGGPASPQARKQSSL